MRALQSQVRAERAANAGLAPPPRAAPRDALRTPSLASPATPVVLGSPASGSKAGASLDTTHHSDDLEAGYPTLDTTHHGVGHADPV